MLQTGNGGILMVQTTKAISATNLSMELNGAAIVYLQQSLKRPMKILVPIFGQLYRRSWFICILDV